MTKQSHPPRRPVILQGSKIESTAAFYQALEQALALPAHFGRTLDALWDVLTGDVAGPVELVWIDAVHSRAALGAAFEPILAVLREVEAARDDFRLRLM